MKDTLKIAFSLIAIILIVMCIPYACTQPDYTKRVLRQSGYTNVEITGWRPFAKSKDDTFSTGFKATSPSGESVTGVVSCGIFKGGTIRLD